MSMAVHSVSSVLVGSIVANFVVGNVIVHGLSQKSESLSRYYRTLRMLAVALDISSVTWGVLLALRLSSPNNDLYVHIRYAVFVQIVHDILFAVPLHGTAGTWSDTLRIFREYSNEHGTWILLIDALIMSVALIVSGRVHSLSEETRGLVGAFVLYVHLLTVDAL